MSISRAVTSKRLQKAIKLRQWCRKALELNDMGDVARLNFEADKSYLCLTPEEAEQYRAWGFSRKVTK